MYIKNMLKVFFGKTQHVIDVLCFYLCCLCKTYKIDFNWLQSFKSVKTKETKRNKIFPRLSNNKNMKVLRSLKNGKNKTTK